jgi:hypothetical protein
MIQPPAHGQGFRVDESPTAERVGRNNATFRAANEQIADVATGQGRQSDEPLPFLCECADPGCTLVITVTLAEYARVRSDPRCFVVATGHDAGEAGVVRVVEAHDGYDVTEKTGRAGEIVEQLADEGGPE